MGGSVVSKFFFTKCISCQQKRNSYILKTCSSGQQSMDQEDLTVWGRHIQHADELSAAGEAVSCCTDHQAWVIVNNQCIVNGGLAERRLHSCAVEKSTEKSQLVKIKHTSNSTNTQANDISRKSSNIIWRQSKLLFYTATSTDIRFSLFSVWLSFIFPVLCGRFLLWLNLSPRIWPDPFHPHPFSSPLTWH